MTGAIYEYTNERKGYYMRIMGLDYGTKTVGVAISDPLFITAQSLEIIRRKSENKLSRELNNVKTGWSFRTGRVITFVPRKIRDWLKH